MNDKKDDLKTVKPIQDKKYTFRRKLGFKGEVILALLPTITVLVVLGLVEVLSHQRLLFASLASSAFLIYLDPNHGTNSIRTLIIAQLAAAGIGLLTFLLIGDGYVSGGLAMVIAIILMIAFDAMHPPAVSTALSFAFRADDISNLALFALAVGITATLVIMERVAVWVLAYYMKKIERKSE